MSSTDETSSHHHTKLHPCIRVYGKCNFGKDCRFASLPANSCLSFLKNPASCKTKSCKFVHVAADGTPLAAAKENDTGAAVASSPATQQQEEQEVMKKVEEKIAVALNGNDDDDAEKSKDALHDREQEVEESEEEEEQEDDSDHDGDEEKRLLAQDAAALANESPSVAAEIAKWRKACAEMAKANKTLRNKRDNTTRGLRGQNVYRLKAAEAATLKLKSELEDTKYKVALQEEITRRLQTELPAMLLAKMKAAASPSDAEAEIPKVMAAFRAEIEGTVLRGRKSALLAKAFDVAAAKFKEQRDANGYTQFSDLIRNECLFSDLSSVGEQFFRACHLRTLGASLFRKEDGSFNSDRFEITFHGTRGSVPAALSISCGGFDPMRRSGQAIGRGEYMSTELSTAMGYTSDAVLAVLVYKPEGVAPTYTKSELRRYCRHADVDKTVFGPVYVHGSILVVDNPKDRSATYMLPLGFAYTRQNFDANVLTRSCECATKTAARVMEAFEAKYNSNKNNNNDAVTAFKSFAVRDEEGNRLTYYRSEGGSPAESIAFHDNAAKFLLDEMKKENNNINNYNHIVEIVEMINGVKVACAVDLKNKKMKEILSGKTYDLIKIK